LGQENEEEPNVYRQVSLERSLDRGLFNDGSGRGVASLDKSLPLDAEAARDGGFACSGWGAAGAGERK
jgi:hypothetical protein